jgi:hypothetical protein
MIHRRRVSLARVTFSRSRRRVGCPMHGLRSFRRRRLIARAGAIAVTATLLLRPSVGVRCRGLLLFLVTFGHTSPSAVQRQRLCLASLTLPSSRVCDVEVSWNTVDAPMFDGFRQCLLFIHGVVAQLMLPPITFIALYSPSVVIGVPTHTADGIVLVRIIGAGSIIMVVTVGSVRAR